MTDQLINISASVTEKPKIEEVHFNSVKFVIRLEACNGPYTKFYLQLISPNSEIFSNHSNIRKGDLLSLKGHIKKQEPYSLNIELKEMTIKRDESTTVFTVSSFEIPFLSETRMIIRLVDVAVKDPFYL